MRAVVTGGSGFIGGYLVKLLLQESHSVIVLSRSSDIQKHATLYQLQKEFGDEQLKLCSWNPSEVTEDLISILDGCDAVFHLAGTSIFDKRWTNSFMKQLVDSRIISSNVLVDAISQCNNKPSVLIGASGVSYYGESGDKELDETMESGNDFLAKLSVDWEDAVSKAQKFGVRTCSARIGIVLGRGGGALDNILPLFSWHIGGHVGNGGQYFPWIHVEDCVRAFLFAATNNNIKGPFNNVSPNPVTMGDFCKKLGVQMNRWSWAHAPYLAVRIMLGAVADVIVCSLRVVPKVLENEGFTFKYNTVEDALKDIVEN